MLSKKSCLLLFAMALCGCLGGQSKQVFFNSTAAEQLGYGLKLQAEFGNKKGFLFNWRIVISGGVASFLVKNVLYPSLQADLVLYHGGIGSSWPGEQSTNRYFDVELDIGYTLTTGFVNRMKYDSRINPAIRNYPLYYFKNFTIPTLQNPYNYSVSWGGNAIFFFTGKKENFQQVGFLNIHAYRFQVSYTNDGPPFLPPFGDKFDRLHTGGGFISFHGDKNWFCDIAELGFNKFTGYNKNTYELANKTGTSYNYYHDAVQQLYNKSQFYLNLGSTKNNWVGGFNFYNNSKLDIQHMIHQNLFYPLHMVPYPASIAIGGAYYSNYNKLGLQ